MICLVTCLIWAGGVGHHDRCEKTVDKVYETKDHYYVKIQNHETENLKDVRIEIERSAQQVEKTLCRK